MKKSFQAFLAKLITAVMLVTLTAVSAIPAGAEELVPYALRDTVYAGVDAGGKYAISTPEDWLALVETGKAGSVEGLEFHLTADIDMAGYPAMTPVCVGNNGEEFDSLLDGHGHVFKNVDISATASADTSSGVGLIGIAGECTIRNLGIESGTINGGSGVGGTAAILGFSNNTTLLRCWNGAEVRHSGGGAKVAGLVGRTGGSRWVTIDNCYNIGTVDSTVNRSAMCDWDRVRVYNSFNAGTLLGTRGNNFLAGFDTTDIANFWDTSGSANVIVNTGDQENTGKLGAAAYANGELAWTLNTNYVSEKGERPYYTVQAGKTVFGTAENQTRRVTVKQEDEEDSFLYLNAGDVYDLDVGHAAHYTVTAGEAELNGSILTVPAGDVTVTISLILTNRDTVYAIRKRFASLDPELFYDSSEIQVILAEAEALLANEEIGDAETAALAERANAFRPTPKNFYPYLIPYALKDTVYAGMNAEGKYAIGTKEDWLAVTRAEGNFSGVELHFTADVDMDSAPMDPACVDTAFGGIVDGHGFVLKNISITRNGDVPAALFSRMNGTITRLGIESGKVVSNQSGSNDHNGAAAFAGHFGGTLTYCWNAADITVNILSGGTPATFAAGLTVRRASGAALIDNCYNLGDVKGANRVSGLSCWVCSTRVYNSYNAGQMSGTSYLVQVSNDETPDLKNLAEVSSTAARLTDGYDTENDNLLYRLAPEDAANGKLAYTLNHSYVPDKGEQPHYTVREGKTVFGTPETETHKVTFAVGKGVYTELYTDEAGKLIGEVPESIPPRELRGWTTAAGEPADPAAVFTADTVLYAVADPVDTVNASLLDTVRLSVNLDLDFYERAVTAVTVTGPDATGASGESPIERTYVVGEDLTPRADGRYRILWSVAAAEMTEPIDISVEYEDGETERILSGYTVKAYLETLRNTAGENAALAAVSTAALQYGACAQKAFGYRTHDLAAEIATEPDPALLSGEEYENVVTGTREAVGLSKVTASALIRDQVTLRLYVTPEEGVPIGEYAFSYARKNGGTFTIAAAETDTPGKYLLEIPGIAAADFAVPYTFSITRGEETYTLTTSVLSYCRQLLESGETSSDMKRLVCAMSAYSEAAKGYFSSLLPEYRYRDYMKIASFNVERLGGDYELLVDQIKRIDPDIVGFQELEQGRSYGNQIAILAEACGYPYYGFDKAIPTGSSSWGYGVGMISKYPILDHTTVSYDVIGAGDCDGNRVYGRYELDVNGRTLVFYTTHMSLGTVEENGQELRQLTGAMEQDQYAVAVGDFNMQCYHFDKYMNTQKLQYLNGGDTYAVVFTFPEGDASYTPIDNILCTRGMKHYWNFETNEAILIERSEASDHNMIYTYLDFPD